MMVSREGFTIDVLAAFVRKTALNPWLAVPLAVALEWRPATVTLTDLDPAFQSFVLGCALVGVSLRINDWLNKWSANNWTADLLDWNWDDEIVLITGGSGGIGASIAQRLITQNTKTKVVIVDYAPMAWVPEGGTSVTYYKCDLSDSSGIKSLCSQIKSEVGQPTVLVNNAGLCRGFTIMEGSYHDVELTIRTNLVAPFLLIKEFLPHMVETNHGHIMNISSMSSLIPPAKVADYAATKAGIIAMHEVCRS
jgi:all-trans-retinol dehydrogenase (NAD+)